MPPLVRQLFESTSSTYTYLVACTETKECLLIDPVLETVDRDVQLVAELGYRIVFAINTHCHADHITGTSAIKGRLPHVKSGISKASTAKADVLYAPGDVIRVGTCVALTVLATPGHTSGCVSYLLPPAGEGPILTPGAVFTGDALLIRGCGRTDFQGGSSETLYESVHSQIFTLPGDTIVYPAHDYKGLTASTVQEEREHNPRLSKPLEEFQGIMASLNLPYPKKIDASLPANLVCGLQGASETSSAAAAVHSGAGTQGTQQVVSA